MAQSPLLGYNTNVKHKGRVFHIQTEDSGVSKPHVMTHVFADGGRILKSAKTSYAEHLANPDLALLVKKLMQDQHKAMFIAVRDGHFDAAPSEPLVPPELVVPLAPAAPAAPTAPAAPAAPAAPKPPAPSRGSGGVSRVEAFEAAMLLESSVYERTLDEVILAYLTLELAD